MEQNNGKLYQKKDDVKTLIKKGYMQLLTEKSYLNISVTDVINKAGVARVSFYRSYKSTDEVINELLEEFYNRVTENLLSDFKNDKINAWRKILIATYTGLKNNTVLPLKMLPENAEFLTAKIIKKFDLKTYIDNLEFKQKYIPAVNISVMFTCAKIWHDNGFKETPEELAEFVLSIIKGNLEILNK